MQRKCKNTIDSKNILLKTNISKKYPEIILSFWRQRKYTRCKTVCVVRIKLSKVSMKRNHTMLEGSDWTQVKFCRVVCCVDRAAKQSYLELSNSERDSQPQSMNSELLSPPRPYISIISKDSSHTSDSVNGIKIKSNRFFSCCSASALNHHLWPTRSMLLYL